LDVDLEKNKRMKVSDAFKILLETEKKRNEGFVTDETDAIVFSEAGSTKPVLCYGKIGVLSKKKFSVSGSSHRRSAKSP
jgi:diphthamide biosynthesis methyltransferase